MSAGLSNAAAASSPSRLKRQLRSPPALQARPIHEPPKVDDPADATPAREQFDRFWKMRRTSGSGPAKETRRRLGVFTTPVHVGQVFGALGWILLAGSVVLWFSGTAPLAALACWVSSSIVLLAIGS